MITKYNNYLLILLLIILAFNYVDRVTLGIVLQDIKNDLHLSDTELGFLGGLSFAIFYATIGIPIARWADRANRPRIIALTAALWSVAVMLCATVTGFVQLLLVRIGVAVGEAGCIPPAQSLIADTFSRDERPRAMSRYMLGIPLAVVVGYFAGGWLNQVYGWRTTFVVMGLPGLALAALAQTTLREPRDNASVSTISEDPAQPALRDVCRLLWASGTFKHLLVCVSVWYFFAYGLFQWTPAFFIRSHGFQTGELGAWLGAIFGLGSAAGIYLGGEWATRYAADNERVQLVSCALAFVFFSVINACAFMARDRYVALAVLGVANFGANLVQGPLFATIQTLVPARMRALSAALVYMFANLVGMGIGPLAAGALSDALRPYLGEDSLRYALMALCPGYLWAAWHVWRASTTVMRDIVEAQGRG